MITNIAMFSDRKPKALGYFAALAAVFITAVYPALTRLSVTTTLTPADLLLFRLGGSGLLFAPFLVMRAHEIRRADWLASLPLSFLHGWGMAGCVVFGLQFAPASHAAALGPGAIAAWIALVGFIAYGVHVHSRKLAGISIIVVGVGLILVASHQGLSVPTAMIGDAMFLLASALGASYLVYIQRRRLNPVVAVALVCVASAMIVVPWHYRLLRVELRHAGDRQSDRRRALGAGARHRRPLLDADHARFDLFPRMDGDRRDLSRRGDRVAPGADRDPTTATAIVPPKGTIARLIRSRVSFVP
ncbi:MAG: DMT family transporter [Betaproteobacteria bacterium]|nr:MAG: DMT family transporter [Betaproteobacteria bacterium]